MRLIYIVLIGLITTSVLSCTSQTIVSKKESKVSFNIQNKELLESPLRITIVEGMNKEEMLVDDIVKQNVDTLLQCRTPYLISFYGKGIITKNLKYYNVSCNDTVVTVIFEPIKVFK